MAGPGSAAAVRRRKGQAAVSSPACFRKPSTGRLLVWMQTFKDHLKSQSHGKKEAAVIKQQAGRAAYEG